MKKRLDMMLVERALAPSREKAKAYIMAGQVYVDGQKEDKAGSMFAETVKVEVRGNTLPYVSRGGLKLEKAMNEFDVSLEGKVCMDVGASTGGFTDCMLQNGGITDKELDFVRNIRILYLIFMTHIILFLLITRENTDFCNISLQETIQYCITE